MYLLNQQLIDSLRSLPATVWYILGGVYTLTKLLDGYSYALGASRLGLKRRWLGFIPFYYVGLAFGLFGWLVFVGLFGLVLFGSSLPSTVLLVVGGVLPLAWLLSAYLVGSRRSVVVFGFWSWLWLVPIVGSLMRMGYFWGKSGEDFPKSVSPSETFVDF